MNFETFEEIVSKWMLTQSLLYKTYSYERDDECFTVEIYTSTDPIDGIYVMVDELNVSVKIIQRHSLSVREFGDISELISKVHFLVENLEAPLEEQKIYEEENPPQIAEILTFKRGDI